MLAFVFILGACSGTKRSDLQYTDTAMDTTFSVASFDDGADPDKFDATCREALNRVKNVERVTDTKDPVSDISRLNSEKWGIEDAGITFQRIVAEALYANELTDGAYDPAIGLLTDLWSRGAPQDERLEFALSHSGARFITMSESIITKIDDKLIFDLGTIRCGYAAEEAYRLLDNADNGSGSISLGATTGYFGDPGDNGFTYTARDQHDREFAAISVPKGFVSRVKNDYDAAAKTSSVIDTTTGKAASADVRCAIVHCSDGAMSAAFAYAFCAMPISRFVEVWKKCPFELNAAILMSDGTVYTLGSFSEDGAVKPASSEYHITRIIPE